MQRRTFVKTIGGAALGSTLPLNLSATPQDKRRRVIVFWEPGFPEINGLKITEPLLRESLSSFETIFVTEPELRSRLNNEAFDLLVTPYGSAFPKKSWPAIFEYLRKGGNWLNLGGAPFATPVVRTSSGWRAENNQSAYHKRIGITQWFPVEGRKIKIYHSYNTSISHSQDAREVYELYVRFSSSADQPEESGSDGPREAVMTTWTFGLNEFSKPIAAPIIQIDRTLADFAGGRWMLANYSGITNVGTVRFLAQQASESSIQLRVWSGFACYREAERPSIFVELQRQKGNLKSTDAVVDVRKYSGDLVTQFNVPLKGDERRITGEALLPDSKLEPGFYSVRARLDAGQSLTHVSSFWMYDSNLMRSAKPLTVDEHFFYRDGKVLPITGTTYMASDVHRKFLFDPNPQVWDRDFREMKEAGVNMIRTGLWTAWKKYMPEVGKVNEGVLRALDAFLLTARRYEIPVIFTFFAFIPETWGGKNAYLDPTAVRAQQEFLSAIAKRYSDLDDVIWDLINEPSFCSPKHLWSCRPNYDDFEKAAWRDWLRQRYPALSDEERASTLQQLWRTTSDDVLDLPAMSDFESVNILVSRQPSKTKDYRLFAQEMFRRWVGDMTKALRSNGHTKQLITVGQDEGGTNDSPNNQFMADTMDFTCLHNWWANDDLVWDSVVTKSAKKANLVEETGIMFYEKNDGSAWRTEQLASNLLERKMAISMSVDGAGYIQWIWNTNCYMNNENENAIGFHRVAGSAKPELEPFRRFAKFYAKNSESMRKRELEEVLMVIPHSQMFTPRSFATEITRKCVRALYYYCRTPVRAVSEYGLDDSVVEAKMIVVPSPGILTQQCWDWLLRRAEKGSTVVISGVIDEDEHMLPVNRSKKFGWTPMKGPIAESESIMIGTRSVMVRFESEKMQRVEKAVAGVSRVLVTRHGKGKFVWSPLPIEIGEGIDSTVAFYRYALAQARVLPTFRVVPDNAGVLVAPSVFEEQVIYTLVSETDRDVSMRLFHKESGTSIPVVVKAGRTVIVVLDRKTGKVIDSTL